MNEAIKLAIQGGWMDAIRNRPIALEQALYYYQNDPGFKYEMISSPLFWQALGKALGFENRYVEKDSGYVRKEWTSDPKDIDFAEIWWKYQAHKYFDLVLIGGNTEKFWEELITHD